MSGTPGYAQVKKLLQRHPDIHSIIFSTDLLANAGIDALAHCGISVPDGDRGHRSGQTPSFPGSITRMTALDNKMQELSITCASLLARILNNGSRGQTR